MRRSRSFSSHRTTRCTRKRLRLRLRLRLRSRSGLSLGLGLGIMVRINLGYQGELRVEAQHQPSGTRLITDAPLDNHGKGESFSPTDLVATGLGSCMATVMGILAEKIHVDLKGMQVNVEKTMSQDLPRRIQALDVTIRCPNPVGSAERKQLEHAATTCPVAQSINPGIAVKTEFIWEK